MMNSSEALGYFYIFGYVFLIALAILWFFLPFAIFGIKDKLSALINEARATNEQLAELRSEIASLQQQGSSRSAHAD
jgi:hypothetical protein